LLKGLLRYRKTSEGKKLRLLWHNGPFHKTNQPRTKR
jgi:hypothetical protein